MTAALQFGDIILVKFHPSSGAELKKYRPAVVMVDPARIDQRFVMVAPFTTNTKHPRAAELLIKKNQALTKDSLLLCWYLRTLDQRKVIKKLGELSKSQADECRENLRQLFAAN